MKKLWQNPRFQEVFWYIFFGGLTTVMNFVIYYAARFLLGDNLYVNNSLAWFGSVLFAFVTNKVWVFHSHSESMGALIAEFARFVFYRLLSFFIDMGSMVILIKWLHINDFIAKLFTQVLVVVANYIFSKLFIFNKGEK